MKKVVVIAIVLMAAIACSKEIDQEASSDAKTYYIVTNSEDLLTKAILADVNGDNTLDFVWSVGDKLGIRVTVEGGAQETCEGNVDSITNGEITISYTPSGTVTAINGAWFPYAADQSADLIELPTEQDYSKGAVSIPLHASAASCAAVTDFANPAELVFETYIPSGISGYHLVGYQFKRGNADRTLRSIKVNNGTADYILTNITAVDGELSSEVKKFYIVVPASASESTFTATITANDGASDLTYTRTKSGYTPQAGHVRRMKLIEDLDDTGEAIWTFGQSHSSTNATLAYWGQWHRTTSTSISDVANASYDSFATITTQPANDAAASSKLVFRANFGPINNSNYSSDGSSIVYNTDITLPVHPGNYPIFAVKMTNPNLLGDTKRNFCLIVSDKNGNYVDKKLKNADNQQNYLSPYSSTTKGPVVMYYDFCTEKIGTSEEPLKNTVATLLKRLNIQFADITYSSEQAANPTFEICWAGFFNSLDELRNYDKIGFYADRMDADAALWTKGQDGTDLSIGESNGEKYVNVVPQNNTNNGRGDIKRSSPVILSRDYPILVFRVDDLNDTADETNVDGKRFSRNINIDVVGIGSDAKSYSGNLGGTNNKWSKKYKCSDGSSILVYDLETQAFSNGGILPEDVTVSFTTFQIKYADIKNSDNSNIKDIAHLSYRFFGFHTFQSMSDLSTYLNDWSTRTSITYSE